MPSHRHETTASQRSWTKCTRLTLSIASPADRDRLKQVIQEIRAAFSDLHILIDEFIIEGDKSVARWTTRSTHTGTYMGIPATGKRVELVGINIARW